MKALVTGGGGFIGGWLARRLLDDGYTVRVVDVSPLAEWWQVHHGAENLSGRDLTEWDECMAAVRGMDEVYNLAADMGGLGWLVGNDASIMHHNLLISVHMIEAADRCGVSRYLESSSACVYREDLQADPDNPGLAEDDAYPAQPDMGYGWAKLMGERLSLYYAAERGLVTRIPRFHNIYGTRGEWQGERPKAPASLCRKVAQALNGGSIEVWGDGKATRSFCHVSDAVEGLCRLMRSDYGQPVNIGRDDLISIDDLARLIIDISGKRLGIRHVVGPEGVRGRNADLTLCRKVLDWEPSIDLRTGLTETYEWISEQVAAHA